MKPFRANQNDVVKNFAVEMTVVIKRVDNTLMAVGKRLSTNNDRKIQEDFFLLFQQFYSFFSKYSTRMSIHFCHLCRLRPPEKIICR